MGIIWDPDIIRLFGEHIRAFASVVYAWYRRTVYDCIKRRRVERYRPGDNKERTFAKRISNPRGGMNHE